MIKPRLLPALAILILTPCSLPAQDATDPQPTTATDRSRLSVATASDNYPVTPGDVYVITYGATGQNTALTVAVQSDYSIDLGLFGKINGRGQRFQQVRRQIAALILRAYPDSAPALRIQSVGVFTVFVSGAVIEPSTQMAWGMSRLSEVLQNNLSARGSNRAITVTDRQGSVRRYDLFQATRFGDASQDPLLKPGDRVQVPISARIVETRGEVLIPGRYHMMDGETADTLVSRFSGGFTGEADTARIRRETVIDGEAVVTNHVGAALQELQLADGDVFVVPSRTASLPIAYFEGAVLEEVADGSTTEAAEAAGGSYGRRLTPFRRGETVLGAFLSMRDSISQSALLDQAVLVRNDEALPVNIEDLLLRYDPEGDPILQPGDRIMIPRAEYLVTVTGAVNDPGVFGYSPGKDGSYYVSIAGGTDPERSNGSFVVVVNDEKVPPEQAVPPGARVVVPSNSFVYNFNRYFPVVTTSLAVILTITSIADLLAR